MATGWSPTRGLDSPFLSTKLTSHRELLVPQVWYDEVVRLYADCIDPRHETKKKKGKNENRKNYKFQLECFF